METAADCLQIALLENSSLISERKWNALQTNE